MSRRGKKEKLLNERGFRHVNFVISVKIWEKFMAICGDKKPSEEMCELVVREVEQKTEKRAV